VAHGVHNLYACQLITYLILDDLNNARFLWKRMSPGVKKSVPELTAIWAIGQNLWNRKYSDLYNSIQNFTWSPNIAPLIILLADAVRTRTFNLISKAYSSISIDDCSVFLGITPKDTITLATNNGWKYDASTKTLTPKSFEAPKQQKTGLEQLTQLTEYVMYLEN